MPSSKTVDIICPHCGNHTIFSVLSEHETAIGTEVEMDISNELEEPEPVWVTDTIVEHITWRISQCRICQKPVLQELPQGATQWTTLYPQPKAPPTNLPQAVRNAYLRAVKLQRVEANACAVWLGRTLEAVCKHENAEGKDLAARLSSLADFGRIPPLLAAMGTAVRQFRNLGAHESEDEVNDKDVPVLFDFVDAILEHLYVAPGKIAAIQTRLNPAPVNGNNTKP